jgi:integrase
MIDARTALLKPTSFYEQKLGHWCRLLGDDFALSGFGPAQVDYFVERRRIEGASDHTITKEFRCMATTLRLSKRAGLYAGDLTILRPMGLTAGYVPRTRALSPTELVGLLGGLEPKRWAFVALIVGLGLRRGEAMALLPQHVDLERGVVSIPGTKTAGAKREVPILGPFLGIVTKAAAALPLDLWGNYLRDLKAACARAGIPPVTANDLRRTHATLLRQAGVERDVVRRLLGHTAGSVMLETVYDQPSPLELAARAGDLAQLADPMAHKRDASPGRCVAGLAVASCVSAGVAA